jgi:hypothetical protein
MKARLLEACSLTGMTDGAVLIRDHRFEAGAVLVADNTGLGEVGIALAVPTVKTRSTVADFAEAGSGSGGIGEAAWRRAFSIVK